MKKKLQRLCLAIMFSIITFFSPVIAGCSLTFGDLKVATPEIKLHEASLCFTWDSIARARKYEIYCNEELVDIVSQDSQLSSYVYDFSPLLEEDGTYEFYTIAIANLSVGEDSDPSNTISYDYDSSLFETPTPEDTTTESKPDIEIVFQINGSKAEIINLDAHGKHFKDSLDAYEIYLYSQTSGLNVYPVEINNNANMSVNLLNYDLKDEIYAVRIGGVIGDSHFVCSDIRYLNPDNYGTYCDDEHIYLFDGYISDMYIESIFELEHLIYYGFIYRDCELYVKLSPAFMTYLRNTYSDTSMAGKLSHAVSNCFGKFMETRDRITIDSLQLSSTPSEIDVFEIKINYNHEDFLNKEKKPEPEISFTPPETYTVTVDNEKIECVGYYDELVRDDKFYETCDYTMRENDEKYADAEYDDFASDKQFLYTTVESSEELYWAVENKITPITTKGSRAETIYNKAKEVLNSIISDEMTDYEKVLSIFDWICANTKYDYYALEDFAYDYASATLMPVFYLEGVFMTGYAVCDGFSKAFSLMCNMEGIDSIRIVGYAWTGAYKNGEKVYDGHAWNKVKVDKDPTDEIDGQYYLVDITWTTFIGYYVENNQAIGYEEVSSHNHFLVGDDFVSDTHVPFKSRIKFKKYTAPENYNYYNETTYEYDTISYDLVLDSEDEMHALFYYIFANTLDTFEIVVDYDYMIANYEEVTGKRYVKGYTPEEKVVSALVTTMKKQKISEQYIGLNQQFYWAIDEYNHDGDLGVVLVFEQSLLIDGKSGDVEIESKIEAGHIVKYLADYKAYGEFDLFVSNDVMEDISQGTTPLEKVQSLISPHLADYDIEIIIQQQENLDPVDKGDKQLFRITVSPSTDE